MKAPSDTVLTLLCLAAIFLAVAAPVLCELDTCCEETDQCCTADCLAICCVAAVCAEGYVGHDGLVEAEHAPTPFVSSFPQGDLPLPERPPIAAC